MHLQDKDEDYQIRYFKLLLGSVRDKTRLGCK